MTFVDVEDGLLLLASNLFPLPTVFLPVVSHQNTGKFYKHSKLCISLFINVHVFSNLYNLYFYNITCQRFKILRGWHISLFTFVYSHRVAYV